MYISTINCTAPNAAQTFAASLRDTGFAVLTHHPVNPELIKSAYQDWQAFFASEDKHHYRFKTGHQNGFYPLNVSENAKGYDVIDLKEFFQFYFHENLPDNIGPSTRQLSETLYRLGLNLLAWLEQETPAEIAAQYSQPLSSMVGKNLKTVQRILHYPPLTGSEEKGAIRAMDHEDINLITLLPAATTTGLQVKDLQGKWHDVPADPGTIVVNVGDMLQECSRGYYKSTTHRVYNPVDASSNQSRYSMPLFLHPDNEVVLSAKHTAKSYLEERLREQGILPEGMELKH